MSGAECPAVIPGWATGYALNGGLYWISISQIKQAEK